LVSQRLPVHVYRGSDTPTYAALTFVSYLNANIQFQDIAAVQRTVQSYLVRALRKFLATFCIYSSVSSRRYVKSIYYF
jgi:hypothetical protein